MIVVVVLSLVVIVLMYNGLIRKKNAVENAMGGLDARLKLRFDLIPNLVKVVKQYTLHEKELMTSITELRTLLKSQHMSHDQKISMNNQLSEIISRVMLTVEDYPETRASKNYLHLQRSLNEVEAQISAARRTYNSYVSSYNNAVESFPLNLLAALMGYKVKPVFVIPESQRENIDLDLIL